MLYYKRKCETRITILLNFYRELNVNFSLSLKIDSLTSQRNKFLFQSLLQKISMFWKISVYLILLE